MTVLQRIKGKFSHQGTPFWRIARGVETAWQRIIASCAVLRMRINHRINVMNKKQVLIASPNPSGGPLQKLVVFAATVALAGLALMFSAVLLVILAVAGVIVGVYLWWKTRELRKQMRDFQARAEQQVNMASNDGVFEGEVIRVVEPQDKK